MMTWLLAGICLVALGYQLTAWLASLRHLLQHDHKPSHLPPISILKPVHGHRQFGERALAVDVERDGLLLKGFIIDPVRARAGRTPQELFVNRRPIKNSTVQHAVIDGYSSFLAKGHAPLFVLFLDVEPHRVDVNVHPTKREVRFADTEQIHQLVRSAVRQTLGRAQVEASMAGAAHAEMTGVIPPTLSFPERERMSFGEAPPEPMARSKASVTPPDSDESQTSFVGEGATAYASPASTDIVALGQMNRTYLIAQVGNELQVALLADLVGRFARRLQVLARIELLGMFGEEGPQGEGRGEVEPGPQLAVSEAGQEESKGSFQGWVSRLMVMDGSEPSSREGAATVRCVRKASGEPGRMATPESRFVMTRVSGATHGRAPNCRMSRRDPAELVRDPAELVA